MIHCSCVTKTQVPAACFVGRSCLLSRKEAFDMGTETQTAVELSSAFGRAGIVVQLQLWESESGRKACSGVLRRGVSHNWSGGSCTAVMCQALLCPPSGGREVFVKVTHTLLFSCRGKPSLLSPLPARPECKIYIGVLCVCWGGRSRAS